MRAQGYNLARAVPEMKPYYEDILMMLLVYPSQSFSQEEMNQN